MNRNNFRSLAFIAAAACLGVGLGAPASLAQTDSAGRPAEALAWMQGEWQGEGWIIGRDGQRRTFTVAESVRSAADGHVLQIHGVGTAQGRVVHDAAGFVTRTESGMTMQAVNMQGQSQTVPLEVTENGFAWQLVMGDYGRVEYEASHVDGLWIETGAWCPTGGECIQNFSMQLTRTDGAD
ncbi:MAG: hypothetical protein JJ884_00310 [Maricaulis sp.]|uniref:hypothetical protein n=1 Tax=Maricaulis sp. TaxID=1486257 RepID=UPI001B07863F|nr:hypothetical protein [Maricaulis sp.]MBO6728959.1 hypothetical protein [Maricaulis sp.]MBO6845936.1 hypothetical protein [Maricaulis sp.]MBO6876188.1 hypothetical protein [Maricaulis sp.]